MERNKKIYIGCIAVVGIFLFPKVHMLISKDYRDASNGVQRTGYSLVGKSYIKQDNLESVGGGLNLDPTSPCYTKSACDPIAVAREKGLDIAPKPSLCTGIRVADLEQVKSDYGSGFFQEGMDEKYRGYRKTQFKLANDTKDIVTVNNMVFYGQSGAIMKIEDHTPRYYGKGGYVPPTPLVSIAKNTWTGSEVPNNLGYWEYGHMGMGGSKYPFLLSTDDIWKTDEGGILVLSNFKCVYIVPLEITSKNTNVDQEKILSDANEYFRRLLAPVSGK